MYEKVIGKSRLLFITTKYIQNNTAAKIVYKIINFDNLKTIFIEYDPLISIIELVDLLFNEIKNCPIILYEDKEKNRLYSDKCRKDFAVLKKYQIAGHVEKSYIYDLLDPENSNNISEIPDINTDISHKEKIVTQNSVMLHSLEYLKTIAKVDVPVLICGETGTGKELFANFIHNSSGLKGLLVAVNVAGLDINTFSDTLFGHEKGAYTGADISRNGLIKKAKNGTIFLDEIGDLDRESQIKLLRLLDCGEYYQLGSDKVEKSYARIITATNRDLKTMVENKLFREDLYYRLSAHQVVIPPLRERLDDLPVLIEYLVIKASEFINSKPPAVPKSLNDLLVKYSFPGNVRELKSMVYDAVIRNESNVLSLTTFKNYLYDNVINKSSRDSNCLSKNSLISNFVSIDNDEKLPSITEISNILIEEALRRSNHNQSQAARMLGITPSAINKRLKSSNNSKRGNGKLNIHRNID